MIPRKRIDADCGDLLRGLCYCALPAGSAVAARIESSWNHTCHNLMALSVRSGFDALLGALQLSPGTTVLMSAINLADMARIAEAHGLRVAPVDLDMSTLSVTPETLNRAISRAPDARVLLVAHLFGSRMPIADIAKICNKINMLLIEDCAQGYTGDGWRGTPQSDVTLFSFGPVKTATALGGALLGFRDPALRDRVLAQMQMWPRQSCAPYAMRLLKYLLYTPFGYSGPYGLLVRVCRFFGATHEQLVSGAVRGFAGAGFLARIRRRPCAPLIRLLMHRIAVGIERATASRIHNGERLRELLGADRCVGGYAHERAHWLFPIHHDRADELVAYLQCRGFDATRKASSIGVLPAPAGIPAASAAHAAFANLLYLPAHEGMSAGDIERLARAIGDFDAVTNRP